MFIPAPGCVLIQPMESDAIVQSTDRNYDRIGKVLATNHPGINEGDTIFFDEYAYRRFTYKDKDYCVVDVSHDGLWGIYKQDATDTQGSDVPPEGLPTQVSPDSGTLDGG